MMDAELRCPELAPGTRVGVYEVVCRIGSGGYAVVYKVKREGRFYALKVAKLRKDGDPESEATRSDSRLVRESACLRLLNVPGVLRIYESGRWPDAESGWVYLVLELIQGAPLHIWCRHRKPSPRQLARTFAQLARAVHALHEHHLFHRDLKSQNVLVSGSGEATVIDLGVALMPAAPHLTEEGTLPGTRAHVSPEVFKHLHGNDFDGSHFPYKATADLHAVGYMLYQALTGRPPFDTHKGTYELHRQIKERVPAAPREVNPLVPETLEALAMRLLEKEPERRPQTGQEVAEKLEAEALLGDDSWDKPIEVPWVVDKKAESWEDMLVPVRPVGMGVEAAERVRKAKLWPRWGLRAAMVAGVVAACVSAAYWGLRDLPGNSEPEGQPATAIGSAGTGQVGFFGTFKLEPPPIWPPVELSAEAQSQEGEAVNAVASRPPPRQPRPKSTSSPTPAAKRGNGNEHAVAAAICAAWLAACSANPPRPDGLPAGVRCPPKAGQPLGVKAMPGKPLNGSWRTLNGEDLYTVARRDEVRCKEGRLSTCRWVREGKVEARVGGWRADASSPIAIPVPPTGDDHRLWGEARADGDRFYFVFTRLRLPDGRVVPLCGLGTDRMPDEPYRPYYNIRKRENGRYLIDGPMNELHVYLLEDF